MEDKIKYQAQEYAFIAQPKPRWLVSVPAGGCFVICYDKLNFWQRMWMKFIGWGVKENK